LHNRFLSLDSYNTFPKLIWYDGEHCNFKSCQPEITNSNLTSFQNVLQKLRPPLKNWSFDGLKKFIWFL
jgi:hypothetical protein